MKLISFSSFTWIFILSFTSVVRTLVEGQSEVIGSIRPITAFQDDDVILPCHVEPQVNMEEMRVEWWRTDLTRQVHLYDGTRDVENNDKLASYVGRTMLFKDELRHGNISLKIKNVTLKDKGTFICGVPELKSYAFIELTVDPNLFNSPTTETPPDHRDFPEKPEDTMDKEKLQTLPVVLIMTVVAVVVLTSVVGVTVYFMKRRQPHDVKYDYEAAPKEPATCLPQV